MWTEYTLTPQQFKAPTSLSARGSKLDETTGLTPSTLSIIDSIDGRLLAAGYAAFWLPLAGRAGTLTIRSVRSHERKVELPLRAQPKTSDDLPDHLLGGAIKAALSQRAFTTLAQMPLSFRCANLRQKNQIVADVMAVKCKLSKAQALWIDGRRGFKRAPQTAFSTLPQASDKSSLMSSLIKQAADVAAINAKGFPALKASQSTASALATLHHTLLQQLTSHVTGTLDDLDIEFLHDLRVSSRRARSLLQTMRSFVNETDHSFAADAYKWIGQQTTDLRDIDVYLADFPKLEQAVSQELSVALAPFKAALQAQRARALRQVRTMLKSKRFASFQTDWAERLDEDKTFTINAADTPISEAASKAILKRYNRICRDGAAITPQTPAEALHDLRKEGKKLRYLLEFFASLYPDTEIKPRIVSLKKLQDLLGAYQDCAVQAAFLERKAVDLRADSAVPAETLMAMGALADQRLQDEKKLREDFGAFFGPFASDTERKGYKDMARSANLTPDKA